MSDIKIKLVTNKGTIEATLFASKVPMTCANFLNLASSGYYDGIKFHRVIPNFMVQGGDPKGNGSGGYIPAGSNTERRIPLEIKPKGASAPVYSKTMTDVPELQHKRGTIAMARSQSPDSASSQFYFTLADISFLDGNYAVFGRITKGLEVIDTIQQGNKIISAKVTQGIENLKK